ncbi:NAD-P-binding protein [Lentinula edodes]|uniref:NAD-P-binding protein n=1 Tax=Lentinula edodes TaxID=5353 RepID=UPI001E8CAA9C|nr:NAD-P-binding protein [Lentinula edodes]KAH7874987.1 NAD-P-binding protein [Lentinula edodes]
MFFSRKVITENDLVDLHGKVALVTGGNTGIGYATIEFLAQKGAKVYMASRNEEKAQNAIKEIEAKLWKSSGEGENKGSVHWFKLELSDPRSVKEAGTEFLVNEERLDILVNNASHAAFGPYKLNEDGLLDVMVVNYISHFVLTETLLPLLKRTAALENSDVRIVNLSSVSHTLMKPDSFVGKDSINKQYGDSISGHLHTYENTKLANILHLKHLQTRLNAESAGITCLVVHPGAVMTVGVTGFFQSIPFVGWFLKTFLAPLFLVSWKQGAMTSAFAAAGKEIAASRKSTDEAERKKYEGAYLTPIANISEPSTYAKDERLQRELYETTMEVLREVGVVS